MKFSAHLLPLECRLFLFRDHDLPSMRSFFRFLLWTYVLSLSGSTLLFNLPLVVLLPRLSSWLLTYSPSGFASASCFCEPLWPTHKEEALNLIFSWICSESALSLPSLSFWPHPVWIDCPSVPLIFLLLSVVLFVLPFPNYNLSPINCLCTLVYTEKYSLRSLRLSFIWLGLLLWELHLLLHSFLLLLFILNPS